MKVHTASLNRANDIVGLLMFLFYELHGVSYATGTDFGCLCKTILGNVEKQSIGTKLAMLSAIAYLKENLRRS